MPPVSICVTTYKRAPVLSQTIDSILAQSYGDFELIISDDCSLDDTAEICRDYERQDRRVKYYCNPTNLKMPGNLNAAIQRAQGDYVANLHDGDVYRPDLIAKWKAALDAVPTASFVFNAYKVINADGSESISGEPFDGKAPRYYVAQHHFRTFTCCVWGTVMARAAAYKKAGGFDPAYGFISDVDMWLRLAHDSDVAYVAEPLITVTPREPDHPFAYHSWQHLFWQFAIYKKHLAFYNDVLPQEVEKYRADYANLLRRKFIRAMLSLIKHQKWERVREGLAVWRNAEDNLLKTIGRVLGNKVALKNWYNETSWRDILLSEPLNFESRTPAEEQ